MFGLTFEKLMLIALIAAIVIGPDRLPLYSAKLASFIRALKGMADGAKERVREELGPEFDELDWKKLDPRQYDPRRILRDALLEDAPAEAPTPRRPAAVVSRPASAGAPETPKQAAPPAG